MQEFNGLKLLIISNNVLSEENNNGKTILSYIDTIPKAQVKQLYFHSMMPTVDGYDYFQLTDMDIIKGVLNKKRRGRAVTASEPHYSPSVEGDTRIVKNHFTRLMRDLLWKSKWKSSQLIKWLDDFKPDCVFFVAGDALFAYDICEFIVKRYGCALSTYVTDDYFIPYSGDDSVALFRKKLLRRAMTNILSVSKTFFTVSQQMQEAYEKIFNRKSYTIVNMPEPISFDNDCENHDSFRIIYAGSLYYGRDKEIIEFSRIVEDYNVRFNSNIELAIYSNNKLNETERMDLEKYQCCRFCGSLGKNDLLIEFNKSDALLFVESFDEKYKERTCLSLSTKVPEYLSTKKPIIAIGPEQIGSMEYLRGVACCFFSPLDDSSREALYKIFEDEAERTSLAEKSYLKYCTLHNKEKNQKEFLQILFGEY